MIRIEKKDLLFMVTSFIQQVDGEGYDRFAELNLMAMGAVGADGELAESYVNSPFWELRDGVLTPVATELAERWQALMALADEQGK